MGIGMQKTHKLEAPARKFVKRAAPRVSVGSQFAKSTGGASGTPRGGV